MADFSAIFQTPTNFPNPGDEKNPKKLVDEMMAFIVRNPLGAHTLTSLPKFLWGKRCLNIIVPSAPWGVLAKTAYQFEKETSLGGGGTFNIGGMLRIAVTTIANSSSIARQSIASKDLGIFPGYLKDCADAFTKALDSTKSAEDSAHVDHLERTLGGPLIPDDAYTELVLTAILLPIMIAEHTEAYAKTIQSCPEYVAARGRLLEALQDGSPRFTGEENAKHGEEAWKILNAEKGAEMELLRDDPTREPFAAICGGASASASASAGTDYITAVATVRQDAKKSDIARICANPSCPNPLPADQLSKCSRCGFARFCDVDCQRAFWGRHQKVCKPQVWKQKSATAGAASTAA
ncbi:hypothetical protein M427DRAFT_58952 [Gonapodya prolifera JEL478]|uniref:MYND-type domain-containing protein n=1 Tax=Gonapodya prolifera (strain JEL478) TaxID=1344416 RepID=A0A139A8K1_GONPJ|nr:hypothetical protein M427DRAFT_58952 [Gonapodya prolifera JEL478]|eukprot:KXS13034.1 hypothetical protein M427DRAFT_58952 [Gonapodya prolifera JEL478]